jgi:hypothetical protein
MKTQYEEQAETFLAKHGIKFKATLSDSKEPQWSKDGEHGHHYQISLSRGNRVVCHADYKRITFDFWGSIADKEKGQTEIGAYDVLACISSDASCPETFEEFCSEFGYDTDSIKAQKLHKSCLAFALKLRGFFTEQEIAELQEIQ